MSKDVRIAIEVAYKLLSHESRLARGAMARDAAGVPCYPGRKAVRFSVAGAVAMAGFGGVVNSEAVRLICKAAGERQVSFFSDTYPHQRILDALVCAHRTLAAPASGELEAYP